MPTTAAPGQRRPAEKAGQVLEAAAVERNRHRPRRGCGGRCAAETAPEGAARQPAPPEPGPCRRAGRTRTQLCGGRTENRALNRGVRTGRGPQPGCGRVGPGLKSQCHAPAADPGGAVAGVVRSSRPPGRQWGPDYCSESLTLSAFPLLSGSLKATWQRTAAPGSRQMRALRL